MLNTNARIGVSFEFCVPNLNVMNQSASVSNQSERTKKSFSSKLLGDNLRRSEAGFRAVYGAYLFTAQSDGNIYPECF